MAKTGRGGVAVTLALLLLLASTVSAAADATRTPAAPAALAANAGWTYVGSGPLATSTRLSVRVQYPVGIQAGDLVFMSCQGKRNTMRWTAHGYEWILDYNDWPGGPPGLRHAILFRWADGSEAATVTARVSTGVNGWSCVISAFRGGAGSGRAWDGGLGVIAGPTTVMSNHMGDSFDDCVNLSIPGCLTVSWFVSSDDNNHGQPSRGSLAFGGSAYDTTVGTDHAVSMVFYESVIFEDTVTMRQLLRGPDTYTTHSLRIAPAQ